MSIKSSPPNQANDPILWLVLAWLASLLMLLWALAPSLGDWYQIDHDLQNFYWMARYQDPTLLVPDHLSPGQDVVEVDLLGYRLLLYPVSLGYGLLFYLASFFIDFLWFAKLLSFILMSLCTIYLYRLGQRWGSKINGLSLSLIFAFFMAASYQSISVASGLQKAFAVPLLILFIYAMSFRQYWTAGAIIIVSGLFYLPNVPLLIAAYALSFIRRRSPYHLSLDVSPAKLVPFSGAVALSIVLVGLALLAQSDILSLTTNSSSDSQVQLPLTEDPYFQEGGAVPVFFGLSPLLGQVGLLDAGTDVVNFGTLLLLGGWVYSVVGASALQRVPGIIWRLLLAGFIMYGVALFFVFELSSQALYWPSRYTRAVLFLAPIYFIGLNWSDVLDRGPAWFKCHGRRLAAVLIALILSLAATYAWPATRFFVWPLGWFTGVIAGGLSAVVGGSLGLNWLASSARWRNGRSIIAAGVILTVTISLGTVYLRALGLKTLNPSGSERKVYEFVRTLPKEILLAGEPTIMSGIPLFSQRRVLLRGLFPEADAPILDFFNAQYAESPESILHFCRRYDLDYWVIDQTNFTTDYLARQDFFYRPYNDQIVTLVTGRSNFILPQLEPVFSSSSLRVIKCDAPTIMAQR